MLKALPHWFRFTAKNDMSAGDVTVVTVTSRYFNVDSANALVFAAEATPLNFSGTLSTGSFTSGAAVDNSSTLYAGAWLTITVTTTGSASGDVLVYLESTTAGSDAGWPDNGLPNHFIAVNFASSGTKTTQAQV